MSFISSRISLKYASLRSRITKLQLSRLTKWREMPLQYASQHSPSFKIERETLHHQPQPCLGTLCIEPYDGFDELFHQLAPLQGGIAVPQGKFVGSPPRMVTIKEMVIAPFDFRNKTCAKHDAPKSGKCLSGNANQDLPRKSPTARCDTGTCAGVHHMHQTVCPRTIGQAGFLRCVGGCYINGQHPQQRSAERLC